MRKLGFTKSAQWADIIAKAKRLIQSGNVTIVHNGPTYVQGHVVGDHGQYTTEISRTDPRSNIIEQWQCECPWSQFAFQRTRKWKKYEGRPCSHVMATYWKGKSTPLDEGSYDPNDPDSYNKLFQRFKPFTEDERIQEKVRPGEQVPMDIGEQQADEGDLEGLEQWRSVSPEDQHQMEGPSIPQQRQDILDRSKGKPVPTQQQIALPNQPQVPQGPEQPAQREQLQLFPINPIVPPGQAPPAVSVPGGRPPTPGNPIGIPNAFSKYIPVIAVKTSTFYYGADDFEQQVQALLQSGQRAIVQLRQPQTLEQRGGKIPMPGAQPFDVNGEGVSKYRTLDLGYDPDLGQRVRADETREEGKGGAPEQRGVYSEAARGRRGEIVDIEPMLKQVRVHIPLNESDRLHPHYLDGWVHYDDVLLTTGVKPPFWKKPWDGGEDVTTSSWKLSKVSK